MRSASQRIICSQLIDGGAMTYMDRTPAERLSAPDNGSGGGNASREALVLIVEDDLALSNAFRSICECLNVAVEPVPTCNDLGSVLRDRRPMAVIGEMDGAGQDGCHLLMTVAAHDRDLPVLLISDDDQVLLGAVEAVQELWNLTAVDKWPHLLGVGAIVDFLFRAGRKGGCMRLMSI
jgi:hypothetical protein